MIPRRPNPKDQDSRFRYDNSGMQTGLNWDAIRVVEDNDDDE
jgi:hypothetical protein